ncbi:MAG: hypothetical protein Q4B09_07155 [Lachnospiraceae bacterium]|nr:hypothetical protein [Lachnospiraceae bacterium]
MKKGLIKTMLLAVSVLVLVINSTVGCFAAGSKKHELPGIEELKENLVGTWYVSEETLTEGKRHEGLHGEALLEEMAAYRMIVTEVSGSELSFVIKNAEDEVVREETLDPREAFTRSRYGDYSFSLYIENWFFRGGAFCFNVYPTRVQAVGESTGINFERIAEDQ